MADASKPLHTYAHLHQANRRSWNEATKAHNSHKPNQADFLRAGGSTLFAEELELLGDISGKTLIHLQCNAGQDTLSLAQHGADVTGVDISDEAIAFARQLGHDSGIAARFERADIYDWLAESVPQYNIAFSSYGAISWLSDIATWARGIERVLRPGGRFVLIEFHPLAYMLDEVDSAGPAGPAGPDSDDDIDQLRLRYPYGGGEHMQTAEGIDDYVAMSGDGLVPQGYQRGVEDFRNPHPCHEFAWGVEDVVSAFLDAGMHVTTLRQYPYSNGCKLFRIMREVGERRYSMPEGMPRLPLMYGLVTEKQ